MLIFKRVLVLMTMIALTTSMVMADEGMWMPHQMPSLNLAAKGLQMNPADLYKKDGTGLMSAVVHLGGGTGEFVSADGLILTNHHVAFSAIQRAADKDHDYIKDGFIAESLEKEIPAAGYIADVLLGYDDVTAQVQQVLKANMTATQRFKAIEQVSKALVKKEEQSGPDIRCEVSSMYSGNQYYLFKFKRLRDVRLVLAPPNALGNYGGEIDNWMWPRYTCDFTFLRAYVSKDNVGAAYSTDNVPYKPKSIVKISLAGLKEGDFSFIMGYPGRTYRLYSVAEFQAEIDSLKRRNITAKENIQFFEAAGKNDRAIEIKYAAMVKSLYNGLKNREGKLEGFVKLDILARKQLQEEKFCQWLNEKPERQKKYGSILKDIETFLKVQDSFYLREQRFSGMVERGTGLTLLSQAYLLVRMAAENQKPDMQREEGYQKRDLPANENKIKLADRGYDVNVDKAYFKFFLNKLVKEDQAMWPKAFAAVLAKGAEALEPYVEGLYANTILKDTAKRLELLNSTPANLMKLNDPLLNLAFELEKEMVVIREKMKVVNQERQDLKMKLIAAQMEWHEGNIAPDANSTIRFTYGPIQGYQPRDAVNYLPFTTLTGLLEKETGAEPFIVPTKLKELYKARDFGPYMDQERGNLVTCFLNSTNITGGNSGSPAFNAKGEQVGIVFDMTYESVVGDYYLVPELQRCVCVDIRYVLFITDKFSGAKRLLTEMGL